MYLKNHFVLKHFLMHGSPIKILWCLIQISTEVPWESILEDSVLEPKKFGTDPSLENNNKNTKYFILKQVNNYKKCVKKALKLLNWCTLIQTSIEKLSVIDTELFKKFRGSPRQPAVWWLSDYCSRGRKQKYDRVVVVSSAMSVQRQMAPLNWAALCNSLCIVILNPW